TSGSEQSQLQASWDVIAEMRRRGLIRCYVVINYAVARPALPTKYSYLGHSSQPIQGSLFFRPRERAGLLRPSFAGQEANNGRHLVSNILGPEWECPPSSS